MEQRPSLIPKLQFQGILLNLVLAFSTFRGFPSLAETHEINKKTDIGNGLSQEDEMKQEICCFGMESRQCTYEGCNASFFLGFRPSASSDSEALEEFIRLCERLLVACRKARGNLNSSLELLSGNQWQRENRGCPGDYRSPDHNIH